MSKNVFKVNAAINETVVAFDPQLPMGGRFNSNAKVIPVGVEYVAHNKAILRFCAQDAHSVAVRLGFSEGRKLIMENRQNGIWETTVGMEDLERPNDRYAAIFFEVDGVYVLNPMAPIGWSHAHPVNFLDFPSEDMDFYHMKDVPHGAVVKDYYYSKVCGCYKSCLVYTPPAYMLGELENLPVLYLQHGYVENETSWVHLGKVNWIMDNLLAEGKSRPCIIVMNNGMVQTEHEDGRRDWDSLTIERMLLDDCIPYIESHYRVSDDKYHRAMAGLSMGSAQTSITTLKHPDIFGYAGIFSGFLGMLGNADEAANEHLKAFDDKETLFQSYKLFFRCIGAQDHLINKYDDETRLLSSKGLSQEVWPAYVEKIYNGGHDWNVWRECVRDFLELVFK